MSYPIHITNIYELLNEDGEQTPQVKVNATDSKDQKSSASSSNKSTGSQGKPTGKATDQKPKDGQRRGGERGPKSASQGGSRPPRDQSSGFYRNNQTQSQSQDQGAQGGVMSPTTERGDRQPRSGSRREGRDFREGGENRSERRGRGAPADGFVGNRRVFDRKSGTGRERENKKGGSGRGGWGKEGEGSENATTEESTEEAVKTEGEVKTEVVEEKPVEKTPEEEEREARIKKEQEEEDKLMTLEDYKKKLADSAPKFNLPTVRKANEGVDTAEAKKWNNYELLKRDEDDEEETVEEKKNKKEKNTVPLDQVFNFREPQRRDDRPYRGGRDRRGGGSSRGGGGPSRGGRGGQRGGRGGSRRGGDAASLKFDENSFPKLN